MKNAPIIIAFLLSASFVNAQTPILRRINTDSAGSSNKTYSAVIVQARYPGGLQEFYNFIAQNISYPESAAKAHLEGKVYVSFVVGLDGGLTNIKILRGLSPEIDTEAVRVIKASPKWTPGKANDRDVRQQFTVPINFALKNKE